MRIGLQTAAIAVLLGIAIFYFAMPARAAETCRMWATEMLDDEGGPVLTTHACSDDAGEAELSMTCSEGKIWLQYDLAGIDGPQSDYDEAATVEFVTDDGTETVPMMFQAMNSMFAGDVPADGKLVGLLKGSASVLVRDAAGTYPARTYGLSGSSSAIGELVAACR
jgi:hypothetical protein